MPLPRAVDDDHRSARPTRRRRPLDGSRRARTAVAGVVVLSAVLTACTGQPAAEPTHTPTASSTPTAEPTPTPTTTPEPERPAAMDDPGVDGAIAAATYFLSLYPYVYNTGDLTAWKALSHPECVFCASVVTNAEAMHAKGNHQEGTETSISSSNGTEIDPGVYFAVDLEATQGPGQEFDRDGSVVDRTEGPKSYDVHFAVIREAGSWVIREGQIDAAQ